MARSSTISSKGQIKTVPLEIRKRLGLKQGDRVEFVVRWRSQPRCGPRGWPVIRF